MVNVKRAAFAVILGAIAAVLAYRALYNKWPWEAAVGQALKYRR
jgi:hypothetical protein